MSSASALTVFLLLLSSTAFGFGANGHRIVGKIAQAHLTPYALEQVDSILQGESMAQASTWADEMRSDSAPFWKNQSPYWHYINIPPGKNYAQSTKNPKGNALTALKQFVDDLKNKKTSQEQKRLALKFIIHIVGDMHQPLHTGHAKDRGGNSIEVSWFGRKTNLHSVWDTELIESQQLSYTEFAYFLDRASDAELKAYQTSDASVWINEALQLRENVYAIGDGDFKYRYIYDNLPIIKKQLLKGGVRLATLLNEVFVSP